MYCRSGRSSRESSHGEETVESSMRQTETTVYAKRRMIWIKTDIESAGRINEEKE